MEIVNKITMKAVCGELKGLLNGALNLDLIQIIGIVKDKETVKTNFGDSWRLKGEFKAKNLLTKEEYYSAVCFLPGLAEDLVVGQMDVGENALQFAFILGIKEAKNNLGYEYTVKPLLKPAENNALALIESKIGTVADTGLPAEIENFKP